MMTSETLQGTGLQGTGLDSVIGMYAVVHRLRSTVVTPLVAAGLGDPLVRAPKRVLVYGPPQCGVRFIADCLAAELEEMPGVSVAVLPCLDDDPFTTSVNEAVAMAAGTHTVVVATSHRPWTLDGELLDGFDRTCFVHPPDWEARRFRLWESHLGRLVDTDALDNFVTVTEGWCGTDLAAGFESVDTSDLDASVATAHQTGAPVTAQWLDDAVQLIRERSGAGFDDLKSYLQRVRRW